MKKIEKLEKKILNYDEKIGKLQLESKIELADHFQTTYFKGLPLTSFRGHDCDTIEFKIPKKNHNYPQDICSVRLSSSNYYTSGDFNRIGLSYYATSEVSDWEINRLVLIGKIAQVVKDEKESILDSVKTITSKNNKSISKLRKEIWDSEKEIKEIKTEELRVNRINSLDSLFKEGMEFSDDDLRRCYVRNNFQIRCISKIKFLRWTNDDKLSLSVEITTSYPNWGFDENGKEKTGKIINTEVYNKVRLFNVDCFLNEKIKDNI